MNWISVEDAIPPNLSPCVVLTRNTFGAWDRHLAQCDRVGRWSYLGSSEKIRYVEYWCSLPSLPLPIILK